MTTETIKEQCPICKSKDISMADASIIFDVDMPKMEFSGAKPFNCKPCAVDFGIFYKLSPVGYFMGDKEGWYEKSKTL